VAVDAAGNLYTGVGDGRILRLPAGGGPAEVVADTGGRPLGIEVDAGGELVVCDAQRGLLRVEPASGRVDVLVDEVAGQRLRLCDNSAVAADGTVYFSDSSRRFGLDYYLADIFEHSGTGRLLRRSPDGSVDVLLDGLQFANGVALAADGAFVAVAETGAYRVTRLWRTGPRAGRPDGLIDNLPGFPDNLSSGEQGRLWIALAAPRNALLDWAHRRNPALRRAIWAVPDRWQPHAEPTTWVIAVDPAGQVVRDLQARHDYRMVTGVREHDGTLYLGSLIESGIAAVSLA
jgi:sugar lactone lactonase YvrE